MKDFIRVMKALSDPNRVRVIKLLQGGELCVCELTAVLNLAQSTVSKHMKVLEDAGLVDRRRQGTWILYSLPQTCASEYGSVMLQGLKSWLGDDEELEKMRTALPEASVLRECATKEMRVIS